MGTTPALEAAARQISAAGGRQTMPRTAALAALLEAGAFLSHAQLHERLPELDRVSLYRALDWLAEHQLIHRLADADGVRRYGTTEQQSDHHHAHFHCSTCGHTACLPRVVPPAIVLPKGYRRTSTAVLVSGVCQNCVVTEGR